MTRDAATLLGQIFPGLDADSLRDITTFTRITDYPAGTLLCQEGAMQDVFYIIGEGQVVITQKMEAEDRVLRYCGPGEYFGEMALVADTPRNASVRTTVDSTVLEIDKEIFIAMIRAFPVIALTMIRTAVDWMRTNDSTAINLLNQRNQEVERAYQALRDQETQRSQFLSTLAHEIRTPLTTANGFMQLIKSGTMTGPALKMGLEKVASGLERTISLVNDLLFVQEMDLIELTVRPIDLPEALRTIHEEAQERASANQLNIIINMPATLPEIEADPDGLLRALRAVLDNAIKFSPNGGQIRIDVVTYNDYLDILFTDPGIGIDPKFLPRIFDRFEHEDKRGDYLFGGMGLGLAIARHLIESFGGSILVQSEVDRGSIFTVRLPCPTRSVGLTKSERSVVPQSGDASDA